MKKRNISLIQWFVTAFFVFLIGLTMTSPAKADQANLSDGTYTVPVTLLKAGSSSTSIANMFFTQTANVKVTGGTYQIQLQTNGADYITSVTVGGQPVNEDKSGSNANLTVNLTNPSDLVPVTFGLQVPLLGTMNQSAQFQFNWSSATRTQGSTPEAATSSNATATPATPVATSSSEASSVSTSSTSKTVTREPNMVPSTTSGSKKAVSKKSGYAWKYVVLKADSNAKSIANKYYTHTTRVKKVNKHYNVLLKVSYKKALKLGSKAVRPVSINGRKPLSVTYGATAKTYNLTYSFNISSINRLKKIVAGKIHVTVPYANISSNFGIRLKFGHASVSKTGKKSSNHQSGAKVIANTVATKTASNERLPQTGDDRGKSTSIIGAVLGSGLLFAWGLNHETN
ncbi:NEAT domain-containing protein [Lentilactobacillus hilgardii]|uniref:NEAT domain-containing protein n=1 Tax=Lentilactobacillus hilgardii TaxID=1588 RepID=UPI0021C260FD|nr:NEAT domain-containing protein [Lentilactobacillus hilgardii]MCP9332444.1 NEAT domain-containing protein [Lentilactobacillus hilgardii]MCP9349051.1 NEAT domain-containing protein [Lentilactobacillus hilgardii]MCP9351982.1 NEAT domain-containing protein [Lentilactobacillus hilgardii]